jgi:hypothetical protein
MKMKGFESKHMLIIAISEQLFKSIGHAVPEVHQSGMGQSLFTCKYMNSSLEFETQTTFLEVSSMSHKNLKRNSAKLQT